MWRNIAFELTASNDIKFEKEVLENLASALPDSEDKKVQWRNLDLWIQIVKNIQNIKPVQKKLWGG